MLYNPRRLVVDFHRTFCQLWIAEVCTSVVAGWSLPRTFDELTTRVAQLPAKLLSTAAAAAAAASSRCLIQWTPAISATSRRQAGVMLAYWMIIGGWIVPFCSNAAASAAAKIANTFKWSGQPLKIVPSPSLQFIMVNKRKHNQH